MSNIPDPVTNQPQPPKGGKGKKILLIVLLIFVALGLLSCIICGGLFWWGKNKAQELSSTGISIPTENGGSVRFGGPDGVTEVTDEDGKKVTFKTDTKTGTFEAVGTDGSTFSIGGQKLPADWPAELALYPGYTIVASAKSEENGKTVFSTQYQSKSAPKVVMTHHDSRLRTAGYKQDTSMDYDGMLTKGFTKGSTKVVIMAMPDGTGSSVTVTQNQE
jgi:hypothetical protein